MNSKNSRRTRRRRRTSCERERERVRLLSALLCCVLFAAVCVLWITFKDGLLYLSLKCSIATVVSLIIIAKARRESFPWCGRPVLVSPRSRRGLTSTNAQQQPVHFRRVAGRRCAVLTLDTTAIRHSHIYTARYAFVCLLEATLAYCSPRITRTKGDNFSSLCTIALGAAQIVVSSLLALPVERREQSKR